MTTSVALALALMCGCAAVVGRQVLRPEASEAPPDGPGNRPPSGAPDAGNNAARSGTGNAGNDPEIIAPAEDDLPTINEVRLADLRRVAPFTRPESGDGRDPSFNARQLLLALADENLKRLEAALHPGSAIHIAADEPDSWSLCRARLGRHVGLLGWGFPDDARIEVVCLLASPPDRAETTWLRMVPDPMDGAAIATASARVGWKVMDAGVTLEPATICAPDRMVYARLDRTVAQPRFSGPEEVLRQPLGPDLPAVIRELVENVRSDRDVSARMITVDEWRETSPPMLRREGAPADDLPATLLRRLQRAARPGLELAGCVVLSRNQLAESTAVFARCLLVFGQPDQVRRACISEWRSVKGIYKLAGLTFIPLPSTVDALLRRAQ